MPPFWRRAPASGKARSDLTRWSPGALHRHPTGLDQLRKDLGVPESVDLDDAVLVHNNIADERHLHHDVSPVAGRIFRRRVAQRRYLVATVVAYAKKRFEEAAELRRTPPQVPYKKRIRRATCTR